MQEEIILFYPTFPQPPLPFEELGLVAIIFRSLLLLFLFDFRQLSLETLLDVDLRNLGRSEAGEGDRTLALIEMIFEESKRRFPCAICKG
jgi:hypothetical protein